MRQKEYLATEDAEYIVLKRLYPTPKGLFLQLHLEADAQSLANNLGLELFDPVTILIPFSKQDKKHQRD